MDTKKLDLNLLVTFEVLMEEKNVSKAAARLHLSQPAVSTQLSRLRDLFNDQLLIPARRGMIPTAKALELTLPLRLALDQVRDTLTTHQNFEPQQADLTVMLACTDYLQSVIGLSIIETLRRQAPNVKVGLRSLEPARLEAQLANGEVDLALMTPEAAPPALRTRHLYDEVYVLIGRKGHPQLVDDMSLEDYVRLEHIVVSLDGGKFLTPHDQALKALGYSRNVVLSVATFLIVPELVTQSNFVALVPKRMTLGRTDLTVVSSPVTSTGFSVGMVWHERTHGHSAHRWVREMISHIML
ncbi:LysR family transcriptional regulator [Vibrio spartinae]|uniref:HTH-type transcriptional regulator SyrM 1 n=1 Tax=Vibrio spartinae TaxID=1918945 RepID=A0A1N6M6S9_9VIBR|nr:LysR family transcriptional regulator [Vibrio spartinae]QMV14314.1 HTH-type transcriptional regulator SyrM 1 [Vibrio spartinae]SIO95124.1 HTH-type transcriptional regulator SyrM 1 [Vibrio spartinae]